MPKRTVICFDGTWNTPAEKFSGLAKPHERFARLIGPGQDEMQAEIEHVDPQAGVETNVSRFYRAVRRRSPSEVAPGEGISDSSLDTQFVSNTTHRLDGSLCLTRESSIWAGMTRTCCGRLKYRLPNA
jgi:hypothetical protein